MSPRNGAGTVTLIQHVEKTRRRLPLVQEREHRVHVTKHVRRVLIDRDGPRLLQQGAPASALLDYLLETYDIDRATAQRDLDTFIAMLEKMNWVEVSS